MRKALLRRTFVLALLAAPVPSALAWGPTGHRAVARIAEHHLTPRAAQAVADLLAPETLAYDATWADDIRSEPEWARAEAWHWVTIPDGQTYETSAKNKDGDVVEAISRFEAVLADRNAPRLSRVQALKWVEHLTGDVHQPLHVGREGDHGGNDVVVLWFNEPTNLHTTWDSKMILSSELSFSEIADMVDHPTPAQIKDWQASTPLDWARESEELRNAAYEIGDRKLSYRYQHEHWPLVQQRLLQAGVRLAGELNRILGTP